MQKNVLKNANVDTLRLILKKIALLRLQYKFALLVFCPLLASLCFGVTQSVHVPPCPGEGASELHGVAVGDLTVSEQIVPCAECKYGIWFEDTLHPHSVQGTAGTVTTRCACPTMSTDSTR